MSRLMIATLLAAASAVIPSVTVAQPTTCAGRGCDRLVYFGTHGDAIVAARLDARTGHLTGLGPVATIVRPTWVIARPDRPILYSVSETGNDGKTQARVYALTADPATGRLTALDDVASGGGGATHLAYDPASATVFVANYGTGQVAALPVLADGRLGPAAAVRQDVGTGPSPRQTSPHAHGVVVAPGGRFILVTDLGADRVFVYKVDRKTRSLDAGDPPFTAAAAGSGPRHAVFLPHSRFVYVISELTGDITGYRWDGRTGRLQPLSTRSTQSPDYAGSRSAAEIAASADGRFIYVSNRGEDTIVAYAVDPATGALDEIQRIAAGGKTPWSFGIDPTGRWLLATNEASSNVSVFAIDKATGKLTSTGDGLAVPHPVSVAFLR